MPRIGIPEAGVVNEPKHIECGAPDFVLNHNNIPRGYIEAKDRLNKNLDDENFKEQFSRYSESLGNLIFTNYLEFRLVRERTEAYWRVNIDMRTESRYCHKGKSQAGTATFQRLCRTS